MALKDLKAMVARGDKHSFIDDLDKHLDKLNDRVDDKFQRTYDDGLHPSSLSGCIKQVILKKLGAEKLVPQKARVDPQLRRIFHNGDSVHERIQEYFSNMEMLLGRWYCKQCQSVIPQRALEETLPENKGLIYNSPDWFKYNHHTSFDFRKLLIARPEKCPHCGGEHRFMYAEAPLWQKELNIQGHTDGVMLVPDKEVPNARTAEYIIEKGTYDNYLWLAQKLYILEIKSENPFKFNKHKEAHQQHLEQALIYAYALDVGNICVLYEDKGTQKLKEDVRPVTAEDRLAIETKVAKYYKAVEDKTLPELFPDNSTACKYCSFMVICMNRDTWAEVEQQVTTGISKRTLYQGK